MSQKIAAQAMEGKIGPEKWNPYALVQGGEGSGAWAGVLVKLLLR